MRPTLAALSRQAKKNADISKAKILQGFFKTGEGEYGHGDVFLGLTVPVSRRIASDFRTLSFIDIAKLLRSKLHEERLIGLLILVDRFEKGIEAERRRIVVFYLHNADHVNNWDLVDLSAPKILGAWLDDRPKTVLYRLAHSKDLWRRRIAIVSTYEFIRHGSFGDTLRIADILMNDQHDLLHKAVGWMLREVGKRSKPTLVLFLKKRQRRMPRTMLRYAIERFPESERRRYLR